MAEWVIVAFDTPYDAGCALTEPTRLQRDYLSDLEGDVIAMGRQRPDWDRPMGLIRKRDPRRD
jgi:uncharacterized membrane protein